MNLEGVFYGFSGEYAYAPRPDDPLYLSGLFYRLQGQWARAELDYTSGSTGSMDDEKNLTYDLRGMLGGDIFPDKKVRVSSYLGLGYRYLLDESTGRYTTTGHFGYDRHQEYYYLPLGLDVRFQSNATSAVDGNLELDYMFWGHNKSELGWKPGYSDLEFNQNKGIGLRASVKFTKSTGPVNLFVQPFWRSWDIAASDVVSNSREPKNNTKEIGLKLGLEF